MDIADVKRDVSYTLNHKEEKNTWPSGLVALSVIILVIAILVTTGLKLWSSYQSRKLVAIQTEIEQLKLSFPGEESEVIKTEKILNNISQILKEHKNTSKLLTIIEENIQSSIYFTVLGWNPDTSVLTLNGVADNYSAVAIQVQNFQQVLLSENGQPAFDQVILKGAKVTGTSKYDFSLDIEVNEAVFNFQ
jgi:hypothetical protein